MNDATPHNRRLFAVVLSLIAIVVVTCIAVACTQPGREFILDVLFRAGLIHAEPMRGLD
jgi:hypothetical protein